MEGKSTYTAPVKYNPSPENYAFLVDQQAAKNKVGPSVGLDRILEQIVTEARKAQEAVSKLTKA